jgi:hypothetical protein
MRHAHADHTPRSADRRADECDAWLDPFASAEADDALDRQLFALREALTDFRSV